MPHPRVGQERGGRRRSCRSSIRPPPIPIWSRVSRRRVGKAARRASRRASIPASPTTRCRSCCSPRASGSTRCASWRSSTTPPTTSPRCSSIPWASPSRWTTRRCCSFPGILTLAWGPVVHAIAAALGTEVEEIRETNERRRRRDGVHGAVGAGPRRHDGGAALRGAGHRARTSRDHRRARHAAASGHRPRLAAAGRGRDATVSWSRASPSMICDLQLRGKDGDHNDRRSGRDRACGS